MATSALILVVTVWSAVTFITGYFFYKILTVPQKPEPDSFSDDDEQE
ncbi:MAG: hypothetical protein ACK45H_11235 [Bacteroidota bacterium]|jgi:hypothetical protein